ncbi:MAG TPA: 50S ribosomal protein L9 [Chlamydiales bacterium]|jgi:large subunit ribosomal protein L9|nr:50S ribosomal protein L9 [Chlamydiales bacterium]
MKQQLLLLEDVEALGKKGEVVTAKSGYIRNFLLPKKFAVIASANTLRKQERLRAERAKQAIVDRQESEELAKQIESVPLEIKVKVDPEGHMYGSVSANDIAQLFQERGLPVDRKNVMLTKPIKETGLKEISIKLKEGVSIVTRLMIIPEGIHGAGLENVVKPIPAVEPESTPEA